MQLIERIIIQALLRDMRRFGYLPAAVYDGEDYVLSVSETEFQTFTDNNAPGSIVRHLTDDQALTAIDSVSESTLHFTQRGTKTWGDRGVMLIIGNGQDVISDHHNARGEPFNTILQKLFERIEDGSLADDIALTDYLYFSLRDLSREVHEMARRVGWSGHGARERAQGALALYFLASTWECPKQGCNDLSCLPCQMDTMTSMPPPQRPTICGNKDCTTPDCTGCPVDVRGVSDVFEDDRGTEQ